MGGRGTFAAGNSVGYTYKTVGYIDNVKVLEGINGKHSLPESSHSSNAYIKLKPDGTFHEMRIYDESHTLVMEIAYHPEKLLRKMDVLRFCTTTYTMSVSAKIRPALLAEQVPITLQMK